MEESLVSDEYLAHIESLREEERSRVGQERIAKKAVYDELIALGLSETSALTVSGYNPIIEPEIEPIIVNILLELAT